MHTKVFLNLFQNIKFSSWYSSYLLTVHLMTTGYWGLSMLNTHSLIVSHLPLGLHTFASTSWAEYLQSISFLFPNLCQLMWYWKDIILQVVLKKWGFPKWLSGKEFTCQCRDKSSLPGSGRSPGEGNNNPLQYSCLGNFTDREA